MFLIIHIYLNIYMYMHIHKMIKIINTAKSVFFMILKTVRTNSFTV